MVHHQTTKEEDAEVTVHRVVSGCIFDLWVSTHLVKVQTEHIWEMFLLLLHFLAKR